MRSLYLLPVVSVLALVLLSCPGTDRATESGATVPSGFPDGHHLRFTGGIRAILEDSHGNVWFGSHDEGAARYADGAFTYYTVEDGLADQQVRTIYEDLDSHIWFECGTGLSRFDGGELQAVTTKDYSAPEQWAITDEHLWFKGDPNVGYSKQEVSPGVYGYDGEALRYHVFPAFSDSATGNPYSISTPFARGKSGRVWFGTYSAVIGYDGDTFTVIDNQTLGSDQSTGYLHVRALYEDSKGRLWIGNNGIGVLVREQGKTINFSRERDLVSSQVDRTGGFVSPANTLEHIFAIGEDRLGNIWFGDRDTGAWRFDGETVKNYGPKEGLPVPHIWQIYSSKSGELWFALADGSVQRFRNERFERIF